MSLVAAFPGKPAGRWVEQRLRCWAVFSVTARCVWGASQLIIQNARVRIDMNVDSHRSASVPWRPVRGRPVPDLRYGPERTHCDASGQHRLTKILSMS